MFHSASGYARRICSHGAGDRPASLTLVASVEQLDREMKRSVFLVLYAFRGLYGCLAVIDARVVAREGFEPPTPAFSGPRSTPELSGLGNPKNTAELQTDCGVRAGSTHAGAAENFRSIAKLFDIDRARAAMSIGTRSSL
jgi:hypothetical protein